MDTIKFSLLILFVFVSNNACLVQGPSKTEERFEQSEHKVDSFYLKYQAFAKRQKQRELAKIEYEAKEKARIEELQNDPDFRPKGTLKKTRLRCPTKKTVSMHHINWDEEAYTLKLEFMCHPNQDVELKREDLFGPVIEVFNDNVAQIELRKKGSDSILVKKLDSPFIRKLLKDPQDDFMLQHLKYKRVSPKGLVFQINYGSLVNRVHGGDFFELIEIGMDKTGNIFYLRSLEDDSGATQFLEP